MTAKPRLVGTPNGRTTALPNEAALVRLTDAELMALIPLTEHAALSNEQAQEAQQAFQQAQRRALVTQQEFTDALSQVDGAVKTVLRMRGLNPEEHSIAFDVRTQAILIRHR